MISAGHKKRNVGKLVGKTYFNTEKQNVWQEVEASHINPRGERLEKKRKEDERNKGGGENKRRMRKKNSKIN